MTSRSQVDQATHEGMAETPFSPQVLREYALLADGQRGAVLGPHGDIVWMCAPRWHDDAVFAALVGGEGGYSVTPVARYIWAGNYHPGTLIYCSRWVTDESLIECHQALAAPGDPHRVVLLRRVRAVTGDARVLVLLDVRAHFGRNKMHHLRRDDDGVWTARTGDLRLRWTGAAEARETDGMLRLELTVPAGRTHDLVLEISDEVLPGPLLAAEHWQATEHVWESQVPDLDDTVAPRDARHAYAVLRGLTVPGGGMVAAATLGLPEQARANRNFDYRYVWVRDQCYAGLAVAADAPHPLLDEAVAFVTGHLLADGPELKPAYRVDGGPVPDERTLGLPGYPGGRDVVGNWVNKQFQLDAIGECLQLFAAAARHDHLDAEGWRAILVAVDVIEQRWRQPDNGIWELEPAWWTQSRLACVAGLRATALVAPGGGESGRMSALADAVLAETANRCLHPEGWWRRAPGLDGTDASLVLAPVRGALPPEDPRTVATVEAVHSRLTEDGYVYRFAQDSRPLGDAEGAFLLCGFMLALAEQHLGNLVAAYRYFERTRAGAGTPGLLAEEYDVRSRQLRGNLPQAFVHAMLLETAATLTRAPGSASAGSSLDT